MGAMVSILGMMVPTACPLRVGAMVRRWAGPSERSSVPVLKDRPIRRSPLLLARARTSSIPPKAAEPSSALRRPLKENFQTRTRKTTSATQEMVLAIAGGGPFSRRQYVPIRTDKLPTTARQHTPLLYSPAIGPPIFTTLKERKR